MNRKVVLASLFTFSAIITVLAYSGFRSLSPKPATKQTQVEVVQGVSITPEITPTPTPTISKPKIVKLANIECVGPDGKHFQATKADCDNLNSYWSKNQPSNPSTPSNNPSTNSNPISLASNPTITPIVTPTPTPVPTGITVSTNSVNVTLSRSNGTGGFVYGTGFTITSIDSRGFGIYNNEPTSGQGFNEASGGLQLGGSFPIHTYIALSKANGTYTSNVTVKYLSSDNSTWISGPTVSYSITLVD